MLPTPVLPEIGMNLLQIIGRVHDKRVLTTKAGDPLVTLNVGVNETWNDRVTKERMSATEWFRISLFREDARVAAEHLQNGDVVYAQGALKSRSYTRSDGVTITTREMYVHKFQIMRTAIVLPAVERHIPQSPLDEEVKKAEFDDDQPF